MRLSHRGEGECKLRSAGPVAPRPGRWVAWREQSSVVLSQHVLQPHWSGFAGNKRWWLLKIKLSDKTKRQWDTVLLFLPPPRVSARGERSCLARLCYWLLPHLHLSACQRADFLHHRVRKHIIAHCIMSNVLFYLMYTAWWLNGVQNIQVELKLKGKYPISFKL